MAIEIPKPKTVITHGEEMYGGNDLPKRRLCVMDEPTYEEKNREQLRQIIEKLTKVYNDGHTIETVFGGTSKSRYEIDGEYTDYSIETNTYTIISRRDNVK